MREATGREIAYIGLFAALTAVSAVFSVQFGSMVPFSLQLLVTLLSGVVLGSRLGSISQASYVVMGLIGLPVFAMRRAGFGVLVGPTGGFLIGFIMGAWVAGKVMEMLATSNRRDKVSVAVILLAFTCGGIVSYIPGLAVLAYYMKGITGAVASMVPFMIGDLVKIVFGTAIYVMMQQRGMLFKPATPSGTPGD